MWKGNNWIKEDRIPTRIEKQLIRSTTKLDDIDAMSEIMTYMIQ